MITERSQLASRFHAEDINFVQSVNYTSTETMDHLFQMAMAKETHRKDKIIVKFRPILAFRPFVQPLLSMYNDIIVKQGGEIKMEDQPPGPLAPAIMK